MVLVNGLFIPYPIHQTLGSVGLDPLQTLLSLEDAQLSTEHLKSSLLAS